MPVFVLRPYRLCRFLLHVLRGMAAVAWRFPGLDQAGRVAHIQRWSTQLTRILGISVRVQGVVPGVYPANHLLISNHISWLDIFVLNAVTVSRFVAKAEIRNWPVVGRLCLGTGTLFIERERKRDTARVGQDMLAALQAGHCLAVFPEGTTSDGQAILPFRSSLLQAAVDGNTTLQPVYLRYCDAQGQRCGLAAYIDDISIGKSLWRILGNRGLTVEINFLSPLSPEQQDRRSLTRTVEARIQAAHTALAAHNRPHSPAD